MISYLLFVVVALFLFLVFRVLRADPAVPSSRVDRGSRLTVAAKAHFRGPPESTPRNSSCQDSSYDELNERATCHPTLSPWH